MRTPRTLAALLLAGVVVSGSGLAAAANAATVTTAPATTKAAAPATPATAKPVATTAKPSAAPTTMAPTTVANSIVKAITKVGSVLGHKVNINTASRSALTAAPHVTKAMASSIIAGRPYKSIADLEHKLSAKYPLATVRKAEAGLSV